MDELVAATAACDMATDANAPKDLEQRSVCGTVGGVDGMFPDFVSRPRTQFFMQGHWEGVGKKGLTAQTPPRTWLRPV